MIVRRNVVLLGGVVLLAGVVIYLLTGGEQADPGPGGGSTSIEEPQASPDETPDGDGPTEGPESTSAARGPDGNRPLDGVAEELPPGLIADDASDVESRAARSGDDWSATVTYASEVDRDELERIVDTAAADGGFERRQATLDDERKVIVYDGADGSIMTVTLQTDGSRTLLAAVLVSP